jgi:hypothetical protein
MTNEPTMIGLSEASHSKLKQLSEDGHFNEMADAYRFAIALALAEGIVPPEITSKTVYSVGTIDPDQSIKNVIQSLMGDQVQGMPVYRMAERLADWGIQELHAQVVANGEVDAVKILSQLERKLP